MTTVRTAALALAVGTMGAATLRSFAVVPAPQKPKKVVAAPTFAKDVRAVFAQNCVACHGANSPAAGLNLAKYKTEAQALADLGTMEKAMGRIVAGDMPPGGGLPAARRKPFQGWTENALAAQCRLADPGRVTLRRLNRDEYNRTVHDLLGTDLRPADDFPGDDVGNGFDNMGDVLTTSPLLMEKLMDSAERLAHEAVYVPRVRTRRIEAAGFEGGSIGALDTGGAVISSGGVSARELKNMAPGEYRLRVSAYAFPAGPELPKFRLLVDGKSVGEFQTAGKRPKTFEVAVPVSLVGDGPHKVGIEFLNDYYVEATKEDRNLGVEWVEMTGPLGAPTYPANHRRIVPYEPEKGQEEATARKFLGAFASRAYRRPATPADLDRLMPVYEAGAKGGTFDEGMRLGVQAVLSSPRFLFRLEQDPAGSGGKVRALDGYEVASRLSYFLWSTMPDATLLDLAAKGQLVRPAVIKAQVRRMIADPKAQAMADNFASQWLNLRKLSIVEFDEKQYPVTPQLRADMAEETKRFFMGVLRNGRTISDFVNGPYTYVNDRMASFYGLPGVTGAEWRRVPLTGARAGVLTQASVLTVTSNPTRTSPTKRGKWVLENLFGTPPPPPPPGVSDIPDEAHKIEGKTLRQLMEEHRKNAACAVCHQKMDPIGFGMENFDPIGRWRKMEGKFPVDASGVLPGGVKFNGTQELRKILLQEKPQIAKAIAEKMLTYALGRGVDFKDKCALEETLREAGPSGYRLDALVAAVATSDPFLKKKTP